MNSPSSAKSRVAQERAASYSNPLSRPGVPSTRAHGRATSRQESPFSRETTPVAEGRPTIKPINKSHVTSSEVRTERTSVVTREKMQSKQRSAKENNIAPGSPRDWDKSRMKRDQHRSNSIAMATEKPQTDGLFTRHNPSNFHPPVTN